jgi:hypothetical protein
LQSHTKTDIYPLPRLEATDDEVAAWKV